MKIRVLMAAMALMLSVTSYSADDQPKAAPAPSAKLYLIYVGSGIQAKSYILEGVDDVEFKGIKCLKGRHADITWTKGKICYIPVNQISAILEYDSLEQYTQDIQKYRDAQLK